MAKIKIPFNNKTYSVDESSFSDAAATLKSHLSTVMNGTGATIDFGGVNYNVDAAKLTATTNAFISHLGTVSGNGYKIKVGNTKYGVSADKVAGAVSELEIVLGGLHSEDENDEYPAAGLYETGSNYTAMKKSWDELLAEGIVHVDNGIIITNMSMETWVNSSSDVLVGDLVLPNDGSVTIIGNDAFYGCYQLTGIKIPNSVTAIRDFGFNVCSSLKSVVIPDSVTVLGEQAFQGCNGLTNVVISNNITEIIFSTFYGCFHGDSAIKDVIIPNSVTFIGESAFSSCGMNNVIIGNGVENIDRYAFCSCYNLASITISDSVTNIGLAAFWDCPQLTSIIYTGTIAQWNTITLGSDWNKNTPATYVQCSDGQVAIS